MAVPADQLKVAGRHRTYVAHRDSIAATDVLVQKAMMTESGMTALIRRLNPSDL